MSQLKGPRNSDTSIAMSTPDPPGTPGEMDNLEMLEEISKMILELLMLPEK